MDLLVQFLSSLPHPSWPKQVRGVKRAELFVTLYSVMLLLLKRFEQNGKIHSNGQKRISVPFVRWGLSVLLTDAVFASDNFSSQDAIT